MRKILLLAVCIVVSGSIFAQEKRILEKSVFQKSVFQYDEESDYYYYYCLPLNIDNKSRKFPLIIYLHGGGGHGKINGLDYLGYSSDNIQEDKVVQNFQTDYPSFILVPQSQRGWDASKIIPIVENFKLKYSIDIKCIYLIGYSMGGSGSYSFANDYFDYNQTLFAGIIRLAGQSQTVLKDSIALQTSIWLHVGLNDTPQRVEIARKAYNYLKMKNPDTTESMKKININGITGTTKTLVKEGIAIIRITEYDGTGHGISRFPFDDKGLMSWLFEQKLD